MLIAQPSVDFYSELSPAEQWFEYQAKSLNLLVPMPSLLEVQNALKTHLTKRVKRVLPQLSNPDDPGQWLSLVLKANFLIRLWRTPSESAIVAMNVSGGKEITTSQLNLIESLEFKNARHALGISQHWCLTIPNLAQVPSKDELLDVLYTQLSDQSECTVIELEKIILN